MNHMKSNVFTTGISLLMLLLISGCNYSHYGLEQDTSSLQYKQTDPYYITGNYEFQSILFKSDDGSLVVNLQHPIHPLPEPEKFISQIGFSLSKPEKNVLFVEEASLFHIDSKGIKVNPQASFTIPDKITNKTRFYVNTYSSSSLTSKLTEVVKLRFTYRKKKYEINFREEVSLVKRWNKLSVLLSN